MMTFRSRESFSKGVPWGGQNQQIGCARLIKNFQKKWKRTEVKLISQQLSVANWAVSGNRELAVRRENGEDAPGLVET
jgi:hypothetical protein